MTSALFTAMLEILCAKRREIFTNDYPPVMTEKLRSLNIVSEKPPTKKSDIIRKLIGRDGMQAAYDALAIPAESVAESIAFAIKMPENTGINEIIIRSTAQQL